MKRLIEFVEESRWMKYKITTGEEVVKINLNKELLIDEDGITDEVMDHPRIHGFLTRIHKDLIRGAKKAELFRKRIKAIRMEALIKSGQSISGARESVEKDPQYVGAVKRCIDREYERDTMEGILESFKHRKDLLQTLSANLRSEK